MVCDGQGDVFSVTGGAAAQVEALHQMNLCTFILIESHLCTHTHTHLKATVPHYALWTHPPPLLFS